MPGDGWIAKWIARGDARTIYLQWFCFDLTSWMVA
jgi:hypothetical protein